MKYGTKNWLKAVGAAIATFGALDAVWIGGVAKKIYDSSIPHLMADTINPAPAGVFYAGYILGTVYLAVQPRYPNLTQKERFRNGALLGALAYGTWGFTGASVLEGFPVSVALSDAAWGAVLTGVASAVAGKVISSR